MKAKLNHEQMIQLKVHDQAGGFSSRRNFDSQKQNENEALVIAIFLHS